MLRVLLTAVAGVLYAVGWLAGGLWVVLTWTAAAVRVGFTDATRRREPQRGPEKVQVPAYPVPPSRAA